MNSQSPREPVSLSPNAITVLEKRYLVKDDKGRPVERPEDLFWRVARTIAEADRKYGASEGAVEEVAEEERDAAVPRHVAPGVQVEPDQRVREAVVPAGDLRVVVALVV